jgi:hypothetical protein
VLREGDDERALAFELLRGVSEPPGVVDQLADVEPAGEGADVIDTPEHARIPMIDRATYVQRSVDPHDGRR